MWHMNKFLEVVDQVLEDTKWKQISVEEFNDLFTLIDREFQELHESSLSCESTFQKEEVTDGCLIPKSRRMDFRIFVETARAMIEMFHKFKAEISTYL